MPYKQNKETRNELKKETRFCEVIFCSDILNGLAIHKDLLIANKQLIHTKQDWFIF